MRLSIKLSKVIGLTCLFFHGLSIVQIYILFLSDFYSAALFLIKSFAFQSSLILLVINGFLLILLRPKKYFFIPSVVVNLSLFALIMNSYSFSSNQIEEDGVLTITTFSALTRTRNGSDIDSYLDEEPPPEILCLQEVLNEDTANFNLYYDHLLHGEKEALAIASKWPIEEVYTSGAVQIANLATGFGDLLVINVHMPRQYWSQEIDDVWLFFLENIMEKKPSILCGDFNMTPYSSMYKKITQELGYEDAQEVGQGFGFTFPHKQRRIAMLGSQFRIDYIFTKGLTRVQSDAFGLSELSDHKAVNLSFLTPSFL